MIQVTQIKPRGADTSWRSLFEQSALALSVLFAASYSRINPPFVGITDERAALFVSGVDLLPLNTGELYHLGPASTDPYLRVRYFAQWNANYGSRNLAVGYTFGSSAAPDGSFAATGQEVVCVLAPGTMLADGRSVQARLISGTDGLWLQANCDDPGANQVAGLLIHRLYDTITQVPTPYWVMLQTCGDGIQEYWSPTASLPGTQGMTPSRSSQNFQGQLYHQTHLVGTPFALRGYDAVSANLAANGGANLGSDTMTVGGPYLHVGGGTASLCGPGSLLLMLPSSARGQGNEVNFETASYLVTPAMPSLWRGTGWALWLRNR